MEATIPFFIVLLAGVIFSALVSRLHVPWVLALITGGIIIGPHVLNVLPEDATLSFLGELGLVFLMFSAGLESRLSSLKKYRHKISIIALCNGLIPFAAGLGVAGLLGYDMLGGLLLGIIFISSSVAVVVPALETQGLMHSSLGKVVVSVAVVEDIVSLLALSFLLQITERTTALPLPLFYGFLVLLVIAMRWLMPKLRLLAGAHSRLEKEVFQQDLRVVMMILIGIVVMFQLLGLHAIVAGFLAGLLLSDNIRSITLRHKIDAISYGIFIPIFFILTGAQADITVFFPGNGAFVAVLAVAAASILSKGISGVIGGRLVGFSWLKSSFIGAASMPQLSTSLAAAIAGLQAGVIDKTLMAAIISLTIVTTFVGPLLVRFIGNRLVHSGVS